MKSYLAALLEVGKRLSFRLPEIAMKLIVCRLTVGFGPQIFFLYDLHNRPRASWASYTPPDTLRVMTAINAQDGDFLVTHDKLRTAEELGVESIPCAEILAVVGRNTVTQPCSSSWSLLDSPEQVCSFLDAPGCPQTLFCKPARGLRGIGAILASRAGDEWSVGSRQLSSASLAKLLLEQNNDYGFLIQPRIANHIDIQHLTGSSGLSTLRIVTAMIGGQAIVVTGAQKLMGGDCLGDAFLNGTVGNLVAPVDMETGVLESAYGRNPGSRFILDRLAVCPASGQEIQGFKIPMWEDVLQAVRAAAFKLRREPLLGFDVAVTPEGPKILEANPAASWVMHQITLQKGGKELFGDVIARIDLPDAKRERALAQMALL